MTAGAGSSLVEVLVALVLTGLAAGVLAAVTSASGRALVAARRDATATALGSTRLEALRAGPRVTGADGVSRDGVTYVRRWTATDGRGRPDALDVAVAWPGHGLALSTQVLR